MAIVDFPEEEANEESVGFQLWVEGVEEPFCVVGSEPLELVLPGPHEILERVSGHGTSLGTCATGKALCYFRWFLDGVFSPSVAFAATRGRRRTDESQTPLKVFWIASPNLDHRAARQRCPIGYWRPALKHRKA